MCRFSLLPAGCYIPYHPIPAATIPPDPREQVLAASDVLCTDLIGRLDKLASEKPLLVKQSILRRDRLCLFAHGFDRVIEKP